MLFVHKYSELEYRFRNKGITKFLNGKLINSLIIRIVNSTEALVYAFIFLYFVRIQQLLIDYHFFISNPF